MFGIGVMLEQLIFRAKMRLVALASVTLSLDLDGGTTYTRRVRPAQPGNDKQFWISLLHLDLQAHPPQAAVLAVKLHAEPGDTSKVQLGLLSPPLPEPARLDVTIAQLKRLLGEENVGYAVLQDSHTPESFRVEHFTVPSDSSMTTTIPRQRTAIRNFRPPETISVQLDKSQPKEIWLNAQRLVVERAYGPWITGGEWWNEMLWNTEQWDVMALTSSGSPMFCCVTHDLLRNEWQMTALYD
jgi:protein ImuB